MHKGLKSKVAARGSSPRTGVRRVFSSSRMSRRLPSSARAFRSARSRVNLLHRPSKLGRSVSSAGARTVMGTSLPAPKPSSTAAADCVVRGKLVLKARILASGYRLASSAPTLWHCATPRDVSCPHGGVPTNFAYAFVPSCAPSATRNLPSSARSSGEGISCSQAGWRCERSKPPGFAAMLLRSPWRMRTTAFLGLCAAGGGLAPGSKHRGNARKRAHSSPAELTSNRFGAPFPWSTGNSACASARFWALVIRAERPEC
mmetsp:Transcript_23300/g.66278  ORF Transcript_23300/g.66278 Transcript_23300/m.66278 type:complete len:259 (-) Transcript_23300:18-794(-)